MGMGVRREGRMREECRREKCGKTEASQTIWDHRQEMRDWRQESSNFDSTYQRLGTGDKGPDTLSSAAGG